MQRQYNTRFKNARLRVRLYLKMRYSIELHCVFFAFAIMTINNN